MAIQPISSVDYASRTLVSFGEKHKKGKKSDGEGHQTSASKAIPIVVLMAMSPLTQCATAENYNKIASSPTTEVVVQNPQKPQSTGFPVYRAYTADGQYFNVWGVSDDDNPKDAEAFLFKYFYEIEKDKFAALGGQFLAISDTPTEDGRYLMMYSPIDDSGHVNGEYEIAYVPGMFAVHLSHVASDSKTNNHACGVRPITSFVRKFGEEAVKNAPNIADCTNRVLNKAE